MKSKKEYIILAAVIAALAAYLVFHETDQTHYELPVLARAPGRGYRLHQGNQWPGHG